MNRRGFIAGALAAVAGATVGRLLPRAEPGQNAVDIHRSDYGRFPKPQPYQEYCIRQLEKSPAEGRIILYTRSAGKTRWQELSSTEYRLYREDM